MTSDARSFDGFSSIYGECFRPVWSYLVRLGAQPALAEDLAQEAFVRWWDRGQSSAGAAARAFLFTTATRLLRDHWRREQRFVSWDDEAAPAADPGGTDSILGDAAWRGVSRRQRQILWLAYAEEFNHAEIASIVDVSPSSVKVLLSRARSRVNANLSRSEE